LIGNQKQLLENFRNKTVKNIGPLHVYSEQVCEIFAVFVELIKQTNQPEVKQASCWLKGGQKTLE
jgi:hypothetical protein